MVEDVYFKIFNEFKKIAGIVWIWLLMQNCFLAEEAHYYSHRLAGFTGECSSLVLGVIFLICIFCSCLSRASLIVQNYL